MVRKTARVLNLEGKATGKVDLPPVFSTPLRPDVIKRAVLALQSNRIQKQGRDPMAGKRTTAASYGVGRGMSRIPRVKGEHYARGGLAGFAPTTVKGRRTFPPTSAKRVAKRINRKELRLAFRSAVAASLKDLVKARGHRIASDLDLPLIVSDDAEKITTSSGAEKILRNLGIWDDVERASVRKSRAGRGSVRGRPFKHPVGALVVVAKRQGAEKAFRNFTGIKVVDVQSLNVNDLAPGTHPGRLTIWTQAALKGLDSRIGGS
jgi:large subunit ribosomal protein L4e